MNRYIHPKKILAAASWLSGFLISLLVSPILAANAVQPTQHEITFVEIPAGCFQMGVDQAADTNKDGQPMGERIDELPRHQVCVDRFWLANHELTQHQWQQIMGGQSISPDQAALPKAYITWEMAQALIEKLNNHSPDLLYRLPTEAEWEYACLAGQTSPEKQHYTVEYINRMRTTVQFNQPRQSNPQPRAVAQMPANDWGLFDMQGNLWEWTADEYQVDGYSLHSAANPLIDSGGEQRVIRGGSYTSDIYQIRCGSRGFGIPDDPLPSQGLRLVRQLKIDH